MARFSIAVLSLALVMAMILPAVALSRPGDLDLTFNQPQGFAVWNSSRPASGQFTAAVEQPDGRVVAVGSCGDMLLVARFNADGTLDRTWGGNGEVTWGRFLLAELGRAVVVRPNGNILVGVEATGIGRNLLELVQFLPDGRVDTSFGKRGRVVLNRKTAARYIALVLQPNGRILVATSKNPFNDLTQPPRIIVYRRLKNGSRDTSFGGGTGVVLTDRAGCASMVGVQPDGKIVVAGSLYLGSSVTEPGILRLNQDGSMDTSFGQGGVAAIDGDAWQVQGAVDALLLPDGSIMVLAPGCKYLFGNVVLMKLTPAGILDTSFGDGDGMVDFPGLLYPPMVGEHGRSLVRQADGKLLLATNNALIRRLADGSTDNLFGSGGAVSLSPDFCQGLALDGDGNILTIGMRYLEFQTAVMMRFTADGVADASFGRGGTVLRAGHRQSHDVATAVTRQADGKVLVSGETHNGRDFDILLVRYGTDGRRDDAFGQNGAVIWDGGSGEAAAGVVVQADGHIILAGRSANPSRLMVKRLNTDGTSDSSFGNSGVVLRNERWASGVALQGDGKIVLAGGADDGSFLIERLNADGTPDSTFGAGGTVEGLPDSWNEALLYGVAVGVDGKLTALGHYWSVAGGAYRQRPFLARFETDGDLDPTFGAGGIVDYDGSFFDTWFWAFDLQEDGKLVAAGMTHSDGDGLVVRFSADGSLDTSFGTDGAYTYRRDPDDGSVSLEEVFYGVTVQPDGKIVAVGTARRVYANNVYDLLTVRLTPRGKPDSTFGEVGAVLIDGPRSFDDTGRGVTVQPDGRILVAGETVRSPWSGSDVFLVRLMGDGVILRSPNGGEILTSGQVKKVRWRTIIEGSAPLTARLYLQHVGGPWEGISPANPDQGTYDWQVPSSAIGERCRMKVVLEDGEGLVVAEDTSDRWFAVRAP